MALDFNLNTISSTEFGVGYEDERGETFSLIPVDASVQGALKEMAEETWGAMRDNDDPDEYQPSEKHGSQEHVYILTNNELAARLRNLHRAVHIPINSAALEDPGAVFCYFVRLVDSRERRLTAVRRATQFKGILKSRLMHFISDALKLVDDKTFKLDKDFDLLIDSNRIHILRPSGFEFIAKLQEAIRDAVPDNIAAIQQEIPFVDFASIEGYAQRHTRAARHLASIRSQQETQNLSQALLKKACKTHGVELRVRNGRLAILQGSEMNFLDILDRRMYELELVEGSPERYRAGSRRKV